MKNKKLLPLSVLLSFSLAACGEKIPYVSLDSNPISESATETPTEKPSSSASSTATGSLSESPSLSEKPSESPSSDKTSVSVSASASEKVKNDGSKQHPYSCKEAKEKVKLALSRSRNNYREVFAKEYQNWLKFESKGSFRLNKVARDILIQYCPFAKEIRQSLKTNPVFESAFNKLEINNQKKVQRITAFQDKYVAAGGTVNAELKDNLLFYQM